MTKDEKRGRTRLTRPIHTHFMTENHIIFLKIENGSYIGPVRAKGEREEQWNKNNCTSGTIDASDAIADNLMVFQRLLQSKMKFSHRGSTLIYESGPLSHRRAGPVLSIFPSSPLNVYLSSMTSCWIFRFLYCYFVFTLQRCSVSGWKGRDRAENQRRACSTIGLSLVRPSLFSSIPLSPFSP